MGLGQAVPDRLETPDRTAELVAIGHMGDGEREHRPTHTDEFRGECPAGRGNGGIPRRPGVPHRTRSSGGHIGDAHRIGHSGHLDPTCIWIKAGEGCSLQGGRRQHDQSNPTASTYRQHDVGHVVEAAEHDPTRLRTRFASPRWVRQRHHPGSGGGGEQPGELGEDEVVQRPRPAECPALLLEQRYGRGDRIGSGGLLPAEFGQRSGRLGRRRSAGEDLPKRQAQLRQGVRVHRHAFASLGSRSTWSARIERCTSADPP